MGSSFQPSIDAGSQRWSGNGLHPVDRLNLAFYEAVADRFTRSRTFAWGGWSQLEFPAHRFKALDLACGNARLFSYLASRIEGSVDYVGLDFSASLLAHARRSIEAARRPFDTVRLMQADLMTELPDHTFDRIYLFGLLHHIEGVERRAELFRRLWKILSIGGELWMSSWQLQQDPRFRSKEREAPEGAPPPSEDGAWLDFDGQGRRYCAFVEEDEIVAHAHGAHLQLIRQFEADGKSGRLNRYFGFRS